MIRLMIVEDSPTIREMFIHTLASESDIKIVGVVENGEEAVSSIEKCHPDIILMDIDMPKLNGYDAAKIIMETNPTPILLMSATWDLDEIKKNILDRHIGVLGVYEKPYGPGHPKFRELYHKIVMGIRLMSDVHVVRRYQNKQITKVLNPSVDEKIEKSMLLIGASTGGPPIIQMILKALPADYPLPVLIAQHMSFEFVDSFIDWLDKECLLKVKKAQNCEKIEKGYVYIAPPLHHLTLNAQRIKLLTADKEEDLIPSINKLFSSVPESDCKKIVAVLLSGMGNDGAEGITKLRHYGALTLGQNEETSIVFGMVNEAIKMEGIELILSPYAIIEQLLEINNPKVKGFL